jgi:hypothetical protein
MRAPIAIAIALAIWGIGNNASAATLPAHDPLAIVVVGDEVNPNGLTDAELTQPADVGAAIEAAGSGIDAASVDVVDSACIDDAVAALDADTVDVLVYFAHRGASTCAGGDGQAGLDAAVEGFLRRGGGVVVFHHGIYSDGAKTNMLRLFGGSANAIAWDTSAGQDVINVAPSHFVTSNEVAYGAMKAFDGLGVAAGDYGFFNNTPDERYPGLSLIEVAGETRTVLFASDYQGPQILGYDLHRADWMGHVVVYQPGEYQPNALDDVGGNNFQILANAIYYVATTHEEGGDPTTGDGTSTDDSGGDDVDPSDDSNGEESADATSSPSGTGGDDNGGTDTDVDAAGGSESGGCGCGPGRRSAGWLLGLVVLMFIPRRRA